MSNWNSKGWTENDNDNFYSLSKWRKLRKYKIDANPICELCGQYGIINPAAIVDHIISRDVAPELELELDNLQSLCEDYSGGSNCHAKKTAQTRNVKTIVDYYKEMINGKLQYICTESSKFKLFKLIKQKGLI